MTITIAEDTPLAQLFPDLELLDTTEMPEEEWLAYRMHGIGGSEAAAVLGADPYSSPTKLWMIKRHIIEPDDLSDNDAVELGHLLEEPIARLFAKRTGFTVWNPHSMMRNPLYPSSLCNPDRFMIGPDGRVALVEIKTGSPYVLDKWFGDDGEELVPEPYEFQVLHYLAITGLPYAYVAALIYGHPLIIRRIDADPDSQAVLMEREHDFWTRCVIGGEQPAADDSQVTADMLGILWKPDPDRLAKVGPEAVHEVVGYWRAHDAIERATAEKRLHANTIRSLMGNATTAYFERTRVATWSPDRNGTRVLRPSPKLRPKD